MELPTSLDQPLQGQIVRVCLDLFLPVGYLPEREREPLVTYKNQRHFNTFAGSFHEMYNCTKHHPGSAVARVTKDRAARPRLPSTVENQLGRRRRRQLQTIAQWNVRTLLDLEAADPPERHTALVAMEFAKYNIDIVAICESSQSLVVSTIWNTLSSGVTNPKEKEGRPEWALLSKRISSQS